MSVLGRSEIKKFMELSRLEDCLIVSPLLEPSQIGPGSIDIRLGNDFVVTRKGQLPSIDPARKGRWLSQYQNHHRVNIRQQFVLHPHQLVLASTLEYVKLPRTLAASVTSRSKWGRAGLVIATATAIHPGFGGTITLELVNVGEVPLILYPGLRVAQIVLFNCEGGDDYKGSFSGQTDPNFHTVEADDSELDSFWTGEIKE